MTNQPATASQKTDEVTNKTTPSMTVDTIFSVTGFSPLQCVAMEREHSCPQHPVDKAQKSQHAHPEPALVVKFLQHVRKWMCLQVSELLTLRGKISFQLKDPFLRLSTQGSQPDDPGCSNSRSESPLCGRDSFSARSGRASHFPSGSGRHFLCNR